MDDQSSSLGDLFGGLFSHAVDTAGQLGSLAIDSYANDLADQIQDHGGSYQPPTVVIASTQPASKISPVVVILGVVVIGALILRSK